MARLRKGSGERAPIRYARCTVTNETYRKLREKAAEDGFSVHSVLRALILNYVEGNNDDLRDYRNSSL